MQENVAEETAHAERVHEFEQGVAPGGRYERLGGVEDRGGSWKPAAADERYEGSDDEGTGTDAGVRRRFTDGT